MGTSVLYRSWLVSEWETKFGVMYTIIMIVSGLCVFFWMDREASKASLVVTTSQPNLDS
jgi:hypothetical protein